MHRNTWKWNQPNGIFTDVKILSVFVFDTYMGNCSKLSGSFEFAHVTGSSILPWLVSM